MKIIDLIKFLKEIEAAHGNIDVIVEQGHYDYDTGPINKNFCEIVNSSEECLTLFYRTDGSRITEKTLKLNTGYD